MRSRRRLLLLAASIAALFATAALGVPHTPTSFRALIAPLGAAAPLAYVLLWAVLTPALFPGTLLAAGSGLLFGTALGTAVSIGGATLGGVLSFLAARRFGRRGVEELCGPRLERLQARIEQRGFTAVLCARLAPAVPATLVNYAGGLSRVRLRAFVAAIVVGGAPRAFAYTALGGSFGDYRSPEALVAAALIALPVLAGLAIVARALLRPRPA
jgi:uncharacterized membrane protein YdjX (TVP38/TMEM64 family)